MTYLNPISDTTPYDVQALSHLAAADEWDGLAVDARERDDHSAAGRYRERERSHLTRAKVLASLAQAAALDDLAQSVSRMALTR